MNATSINRTPDKLPNQGNNRIHSHKFALMAFIASLSMMFAALLSAYVVRKSSGNWLEFDLPNTFFISTMVLLSSSLILQGSYTAYKKGNAVLYRSLMLLGFVLGIAFVVLQYKGWLDLNAKGIFMDTNPSSSFVFAISIIHAAHVLGGIVAVLIAMIFAYGLKYKVTARRKLRFELVLIYWHFIDILWVFLLVFFIVQ